MAQEHTPDGQRPIDEDVADAVGGQEVLAKIWMLEGCRLPSLGLSLRSMGTLCSSATGFRLIRFQERVPQSSGALLKA